MLTAEEHRLKELSRGQVPPWKKWGPYVAERAWGTVREDYSENGDAWSYFSHDEAAYKTYRWGEDAIAGFCDRYQTLIFAPVFWNGKDKMLKERLFGLNSFEGNHAEDVKEYYYHLDATPTHSYMKFLYKYPQNAFPYDLLREENRKRSTQDSEYELADTGTFQEGRYFDIFVEYAKASPEDICIRIEARNVSEFDAPLHILPHLWFRNQWAWGESRLAEPKIVKGPSQPSCLVLIADDGQTRSPPNLSFDYHLGKRYFYGPQDGVALFTNNETRPSDDARGFFKDGFHRAILKSEAATNPSESGTKACLHYFFEHVPAKGSVVLYFRLSEEPLKKPLEDVDRIIALRRKEADRFYAKIYPKKASLEEKKIQRQALAGLLWSKQIYLYDVNVWIKGDNPHEPPPEVRRMIRNVHWRHLNSMRVLCMPDKWEYPYFCAWDQAFHCLTLGLVDIELAKEQLWLLLFDQFQHPNGQIPACEWEFSDLNPPVHGWAALRLYQMEESRYGNKDRNFLERCFHKLLMNFSWWVNKVDSSGNNVFEGGFLGLDNITVLDRSQRLGGGVKLQQSDGTGWMAMFCLNLMTMALELADENVVYESLATKFFQHYVYIAHAMKKRGNRDYEMWSDRDHFFYDVLTYPDGSFAKFRVRSLVGIIPLYAVEILDEGKMAMFPEFYKNFFWFAENRPDLVKNCIIPIDKGGEKKYVLALMNADQLHYVLKYVWDPQEFRSDFGLRSLSKYHQENPFVFEDKQVGYEPAESLHKVKGGNSNWRGPIWFPTTFLLIDALKKFAEGLGDDFVVQVDNELPVKLQEMAQSFADRLIKLFDKDINGIRPAFGEAFPYKDDPLWCDYLTFFEYYHPETGQGLGASHQTGWSALVANLIDEFRK
ncbi:MAG: MGH1-like glycoside hydrolase domain-containing protein [Anaerolineae bacterium]